MNAIWLSRYIGCMFVLLAAMASIVTYHPDVQHLGRVLPPVFGSAALLSFGLAILLGRLPTTHWVHQSKPVWCGLVVIASAVTLLVAVG